MIFERRENVRRNLRPVTGMRYDHRNLRRDETCDRAYCRQCGNGMSTDPETRKVTDHYVNRA